VYVGNISSVQNRFPHTVLRVNGRDVLVLDRNARGQIAITAEVRDLNGKIIATIDRNNFNLTQNALETHKPMPDKSTLVVYDEYGKRVLYVRYLNRHAIRIAAILFSNGHPIDLPIQDSYNGFCSKNNGGMVDFAIG